MERAEEVAQAENEYEVAEREYEVALAQERLARIALTTASEKLALFASALVRTHPDNPILEFLRDPAAVLEKAHAEWLKSMTITNAAMQRQHEVARQHREASSVH